MKHFLRSFTLLLYSISIVYSQSSELEPNDLRTNAQPFSTTLPHIITATFSSVADIDYYSMALDKNKMYYITSIEAGSDVTPNIELNYGTSLTNLISVNVSGRNGNRNFRLSGFVPPTTGTYYAKIFNAGPAAGTYKIRLAGGRTTSQLVVHEPDNTIANSMWQSSLAADDTLYGAIYPDNDVDYYRLTAKKGERYTISTIPILDLHPRDADTFLILCDSTGALIAQNDDLGTISTSSGAVNCTYSKLTGSFPRSGTFYVMVRSFYNSNYQETVNESNPGKGEYGLYLQIEPAIEEKAIARYPHIACPTPHSVLVQWQTAEPAPTHLQWGEDRTCRQAVHSDSLKTDHLVKLDGLTPQTRYYYRVITTADTTECITFWTAKPATTSQVNFFVISDSSPYAGFGSSVEQRQIAEQIQKVDYDFGLHAGDINQHRGEEYDLVFYQPYKDIVKHTPIFTCIGNHDNAYDYAQTYLNSFYLPHNNPDSTERYYSFNYGHVHCISLDTNLPYSPGSPMYEWLVQDLSSIMRQETKWTFVFFHHPPWSEGWPGYPGEANVRTYLVPLFEKYRVDMVFNGHTHDFERGFLNGVYYIITGGGGCTLEDGIQAYDYPHVSVWINQHHFTYIRTDGKTLILRAINKDGQTIDLHEFDKSSPHPTSTPHMREIVPESYALHPNFPNPFNASTVIQFDIQQEEKVSLSIFDLQGRMIKRLMQGTAGPGSHSLIWDGTNAEGFVVASGVYLIELSTPNFRQIRRALLVK